jgi:hypothetical protein
MLDKRGAEPLPVWFFVGLILVLYGAIVLVAGLIGDDRPTVLKELRPALWWGGVMLAGGAVFLGIGLRGRGRRGVLALAIAVGCAATAPRADAQTRTWYLLPTGNGQGFQVFDRQQNRITYFLEQPYRYVAPGDDGRTFGIGRRNLAHDIYFGVRIGGASKWLMKCGTTDCVDYSNVEYESDTHVIHGTTSFQGAALDTYFFAPFGYAGNGMLMLLKVTNGGGAPLSVSAFAKPNLKLGSGRVDPDDTGESLRWVTSTPAHGEETGPGGGHAIYVPIGDVTQASCGSDAALYSSVLQSGSIGTTQTCSGNSQVFVFQKDLTVAAGSEAWWGVAVLFLNDNPNDARASLFADTRSVSDILSLWTAFAQGKDAKQLHDDAISEMEGWRKTTAPSGLSAVERKLWRQSEVILRMGQIRERARKNDGMILASLPPGEWHTGWVRDATYAVNALALTGHVDEARRAVEFFLGADSGFFSAGNYLGRSYRIGVCRYFGDGLEEGDFNQDGPNIETDGWGLVLWAARLVLDQSCDKGWLDTLTWKGDTVFAALTQIAQNIEALQTSNLPNPDTSIWEVHWDRRQVFSYTAATWIRGLFDFAAIAGYYGRSDLADKYRTMAAAMLTQAKTSLVNQPTQSFASHLGVAGSDVHVDGSTMAFLDFGLVPPSDALYTGTMSSYSRLLTGFGGYRRLEPQLSLTGGGTAGTYDLSEWILLDLRIGDAWRRAGNASQADQLLGKVTSSAAVNDFLIPELYDPNSGSYTGVVPMVGYGAGAWMVSQLFKSGVGMPATDATFAHCSACSANPCSGAHEMCVEGGQAGFTCNCAPGYHRDNGACVADTVCDPATTCAGHGTCADAGLQCLCNTGYTDPNCADCQSGYHRDGAGCSLDTACSPNPCTEPFKTQCTEAGGTATCGCDSGYHDEGGSCVADTSGTDGGVPRPTRPDGTASICGISGGGLGDLFVIVAAIFVGLGLAGRKRSKA